MLLERHHGLKSTSGWNIEERRETLFKSDQSFRKKDIVFYHYRPFDLRFTYYCDFLRRLQYKVMKNILHDNLSLVVMRQYLFDTVKTYNYIFCVNTIFDNRIFLSNRGAGFGFPLYLYSSKEKKGLFHAEEETRESNIKPELFQSLSKAYKEDISPEEIFYYIYAVLYSETYRSKYAEFLKIDFPRVPFTKDYKLFSKMSEYGNRLVNLHLLKSQELDSPIAQFQGNGNNKVEKPKYDDKAGRIYINKEQYFEGISEEVWRYQIGGYQVCDKWLKDRKERTLTLDEIKTYCRIVTAIQKTIEIQRAIDEIYGEIEGGIAIF